MNESELERISTRIFFIFEQVLLKMEKKAKLERRYNSKRQRMEWALVSESSPSKVLKWFGPHKPSKAKVLKEERRINWFKYKNKSAWLTEETTVPNTDAHPSTKDDAEILKKFVYAPSLSRLDLFGPQEETEFGSGLLEKDKELYPRWEFTETPQFRYKLSFTSRDKLQDEPQSEDVPTTQPSKSETPSSRPPEEFKLSLPEYAYILDRAETQFSACRFKINSFIRYLENFISVLRAYLSSVSAPAPTGESSSLLKDISDFLTALLEKIDTSSLYQLRKDLIKLNDIIDDLVWRLSRYKDRLLSTDPTSGEIDTIDTIINKLEGAEASSLKVALRYDDESAQDVQDITVSNIKKNIKSVVSFLRGIIEYGPLANLIEQDDTEPSVLLTLSHVTKDTVIKVMGKFGEKYEGLSEAKVSLENLLAEIREVIGKVTEPSMADPFFRTPLPESISMYEFSQSPLTIHFPYLKEQKERYDVEYNTMSSFIDTALKGLERVSKAARLYRIYLNAQKYLEQVVFLLSIKEPILDPLSEIVLEEPVEALDFSKIEALIEELEWAIKRAKSELATLKTSSSSGSLLPKFLRSFEVLLSNLYRKKHYLVGLLSDLPEQPRGQQRETYFSGLLINPVAIQLKMFLTTSPFIREVVENIVFEVCRRTPLPYYVVLDYIEIVADKFVPQLPSLFDKFTNGNPKEAVALLIKKSPTSLLEGFIKLTLEFVNSFLGDLLGVIKTEIADDVKYIAELYITGGEDAVVEGVKDASVVTEIKEAISKYGAQVDKLFDSLFDDASAAVSPLLRDIILDSLKSTSSETFELEDESLPEDEDLETEL